jgi:hypothetical protein
VLGEIRKQKTLQQLSAGAVVTAVTVFGDGDLAAQLGGVVDDLKAAARAETLRFQSDAAFRVDVTGGQERAR